jgi:guanine deaminase
MDKSHEFFMSEAIRLSIENVTQGGGPFGAVITRKGKILSEAFNRVVLSNDPTAHAEILAIRDAASGLKSHDLNECVLYTTCEPCPMCLGAIYWAGIQRVVYASDRKDAENAGFSDNLIYEEITLSPADRKISFAKITEEGAREIFRVWDKLENKIPY